MDRATLRSIVPPLLQRLSTWVLMLLLLVEGVVAGNAFVLCFEPGGAISVETTLDGKRCGECPNEDPEKGHSKSLLAESQECCPCVDVSLDVPTDRSRIDRQPFELQLVQLAAMPAPSVGSLAGEARSMAALRRFREQPTGPPTLVGHVVLRV